jgi:hypothetical protein
MPTWSDRRTWQAMRDVEQSYWFRLAKGIVQPIEASGEYPQAEDATGVRPDHSRTASTPSGSAGRASCSPDTPEAA